MYGSIMGVIKGDAGSLDVGSLPGIVLDRGLGVYGF